ncbi:uncharacterized protein Dvar_22440 [Desulfosarcina variabilis str. Montpellier]|uniref:hypothetical protein n=1 Tax=Desulfosarcina variabilis TaxID=2300 RepID=UPI003AFA1658
MMDFLDSLIDRHRNAPPRITPRIPSIYEPENSYLRVAHTEVDGPIGMDETAVMAPMAPLKKNARVPVEPTHPELPAFPDAPILSPAVAESRPANPAPGVVSPAVEEEPQPTWAQPEKVPLFPFATQTADAGQAGSSNHEPAVPIIGDTPPKRETAHDEPASLYREPRSNNRPVDAKAHTGNTQHVDMADRDQSLIQLCDETKPVCSGTGPPSAVRVTPLTVNVSHVQPDAHISRQTSHSRVKVGDQAFLKEDRAASLLSPLETEHTAIQERHSKGCDHDRPGYADQDGGILKPPAVRITPAIPSAPQPRPPAPEPEPVINVTIGRVEVRAMAQAASKRPQPRRPAPMSLDDYLERRNGGAR